MMLSVHFRACHSLSLWAALLLSGCWSVPQAKTTTSKPNTGFKGACQRSTDCRSGLYCDTSTYTCQPAGSTIQDAPCTLSAECMQGFYCTQDPVGGKCAPAGTGAAGAVCAHELGGTLRMIRSVPPSSCARAKVQAACAPSQAPAISRPPVRKRRIAWLGCCA
jgi:hypothetical protein